MNQNSEFAPVVMFVYNRADHFEQTYRALSACPEAKDTDLYIFSDGAKNEQNEEKVAQVRAALHRAEAEGCFKSVHISESPVNKGLAKSVIAGVSQVIASYGTAVVVEDDCVVSPYFLRYMNQCLAQYRNDPTVGSISGFTPAFPLPADYPADVFLTYRSCSWGWATWRDRWDSVNWDTAIIREFYRHPSLIRKLNACGSDRFLRLYRQTKGNSSSWSVRFGANLVLKNLYTVYPRYSYVRNIGCDASGVHSRSEDADKVRVDLTKAIPAPRLTPAPYRKDIQRTMKRYYAAGVGTEIKRALATAYLVVCKPKVKQLKP